MDQLLERWIHTRWTKCGDSGESDVWDRVLAGQRPKL